MGTFPIGSRSYPRIGSHDLGIQIDIIDALLIHWGALGDGIMRGPKVDGILSGREPGPFSGPGERSQGIKTGDLQEMPVRTWWDPSRGPKPAKSGKNLKIAGLPG